MGMNYFLFDLDGTLIDTEAAFQLALQETMEEFLGHSNSLAELHYTFGMPTETTLRVLGFPDVPSAHRVWERKCMEKLGKVRLYNGIPQLLKALRLRGYTLGIVSSQSRKEYDLVFLPLGLGDYFDTTVLLEDTEKHKPDPEPLLYYMQVTGAKPEEVLYVGDSAGDMLCAVNAGATGALACWGRYPAQVEVHYRADRPGQLLDLLFQLEAAERL